MLIHDAFDVGFLLECFIWLTKIVCCFVVTNDLGVVRFRTGKDVTKNSSVVLLWMKLSCKKWKPKETRPEVSKLTPEKTRNSQVAKLSPAESRLKHIDRHTKTMNSFWISLQTFQECLLKVSERNLKLLMLKYKAQPQDVLFLLSYL